MPARATLSLADGEATPVIHVFEPHGDINNGVAAFRNLNTTNVGASEVITIGVRDSLAKPEDFQVPGKQVSPRKWTMKIVLPYTYVDSVSGLTLISHINTGKWESLLHPTTTEQDAKNLRFIGGNALKATSSAVLTQSHDLGIPIW